MRYNIQMLLFGKVMVITLLPDPSINLLYCFNKINYALDPFVKQFYRR